MNDIFANVDRSKVAVPSSDFLAFVAAMPVREVSTKDKRRSPRMRLQATVLAVPLDDSHQPCGEPFVAVAVDMSNRGVGLMHTKTVAAKFLALEIAAPGGPTMQLIAKVVRCRSYLGFVSLGCEFVKRLKAAGF